MNCPSCKADLYLNKDGIGRTRISCTGSIVCCSFYNCCFKNDKLDEFYFKDNKSYDIRFRLLLHTHPKTYLETIKQLIVYLKDSKSVNHSLSKTDVYRIFELIAKRKDLDDELFKIMSGFRHDGIRQNLATNETTPHVYLKHIIATSKNNHTVELAKQTLNKCLE